MKIVNREEFLKLPENTLYTKYEPCVVEDLCIKGETWGNDFLVQDITLSVKSTSEHEWDVILELAEIEGSSFDMDFDIEGRDGMFDDDQLFMVWEPKDVKQLINRLLKCIPEDYPQE